MNKKGLFVLALLAVFVVSCSAQPAIPSVVPVSGGEEVTSMPTKAMPTETATTAPTETAEPTSTSTMTPVPTETSEPTFTPTASLVPTPEDDGRVWTEVEHWRFWGEAGSHILADPEFMPEDDVSKKIIEAYPEYILCIQGIDNPNCPVGSDISWVKKYSDAGLYPALLCGWLYTQYEKGTEEKPVGDDGSYKGGHYQVYNSKAEVFGYLQSVLGTEGREPYCYQFAP